MMEGERGLSRISFIRRSIPFMRASSSRPSHFPKALLPNSITLGLGFQRTNLGGLGSNANIQSQHWSGAHMPFDISFLSLPIIYVLMFLPLVPFLTSLITPDPVTDDINFFSICIHYALTSLSYSLLTLSQSAVDPPFGCKHWGV